MFEILNTPIKLLLDCSKYIHNFLNINSLLICFKYIQTFH